MKKRILSVIFAAFMLSACAFGFAACGEKTTVGTPQDNETEQGSNGNNTQGGETDDPQGGDEPVVRTTVTEEEWRSALRMDGVRNVTMTIDVELNDDGTLKHYFAIGKIDEDRWYYRQAENEITSREEYYKILEKLSGNMDYADPWLPDLPLYPATEYAEATIYLANIYDDK